MTEPFSFKRGLLPALFSIALFLSCIFPAHAEPAISERFDNYTIQGKSREDLLTAMQRQAARFAGREYYGSTEWKIKWGYHNESDDAQCHVTSFQVSEDVVIHMPEWSDFSAASPSLQHDWISFVKVLLEHEKGHAQIGKACAYEVEKILKKTKTFPTCGKLDDAINRAVNMKIEEYQKKDFEYDKKTNHGLTQGAIWKSNLKQKRF